MHAAETAKVKSVYFRQNNTWEVLLRDRLMDINKTPIPWPSPLLDKEERHKIKLEVNALNSFDRKHS